MSETANEGRSTHINALDITRIALVLVAAAVVWMRLWEPFPQVSVIGLLAAIIGGFPIYRESVRIDSRTANENNLLDFVNALRIGRRSIG